jgi:hypothetical protein
MKLLLLIAWNRMKTDEALLQKYRYNFLTRRAAGDCDATCKKRVLCGIQHSTLNGNKQCQEA